MLRVMVLEAIELAAYQLRSPTSGSPCRAVPGPPVAPLPFPTHQLIFVGLLVHWFFLFTPIDDTKPSSCGDAKKTTGYRASPIGTRYWVLMLTEMASASDITLP